jgi:hypothetical protein
MLLIGTAVMNKNVIAWPANSSATTSRGSVSSVAAIAEGANFMQTIEPSKTKTTITIDTAAVDKPKQHIRAKSIAGGSEPHVPGATGSQPRPRHDASNLLIVIESYLKV